MKRPPPFLCSLPPSLKRFLPCLHAASPLAVRSLNSPPSLSLGSAFPPKSTRPCLASASQEGFGWIACMTSFSRDAFYDDILELLRRLQSVGFCTDLDTSADGNAGRGEENLGQMFEGILSVFLKEISQAENYLPFPVMLGQEGDVDVCKLYCDVSKKGGYNSVTTSNSWPSVAQKVGHGSTVGPAVKLVYVKYLNGLDQWFEKVLGRKVGYKSDKKDDTILDQPGRGRKYYSSPMKKRKSMDGNLGILSWVKRVAKKAGDRIIGHLLLEKEFNQALLVRQAIFKPPEGALLQKRNSRRLPNYL